MEHRATTNFRLSFPIILCSHTAQHHSQGSEGERTDSEGDRTDSEGGRTDSAGEGADSEGGEDGFVR